MKKFYKNNNTLFTILLVILSLILIVAIIQLLNKKCPNRESFAGYAIEFGKSKTFPPVGPTPTPPTPTPGPTPTPYPTLNKEVITYKVSSNDSTFGSIKNPGGNLATSYKTTILYTIDNNYYINARFYIPEPKDTPKKYDSKKKKYFSINKWDNVPITMNIYHNNNNTFSLPDYKDTLYVTKDYINLSNIEIPRSVNIINILFCLNDKTYFTNSSGLNYLLLNSTNKYSKSVPTKIKTSY